MIILWSSKCYCSDCLFLFLFDHLQLIAVGIDNLDWMSADFPDFVAKTRAAVCGELQSVLLTVRQHTDAIRSTAGSWSKVPGMDLFSAKRGKSKLPDLQQRHGLVS